MKSIYFSTILYYPYSWIMVKGQTTWRGIDSGCGYIVLSTRYTIKDDETLCRMNHLAGLLLGKDTVLNNN